MLLNQPIQAVARGFVIETRYLGPTDTKGSRVMATSRRDTSLHHRITVAYQHELDTEGAHRYAAEALIRKIEREGLREASGGHDGWIVQHPIRIVGCGYNGSRGYVYLCNRGEM